MKKFTDLIAWQKGHELVINVYKCSKDFPQEELYSLTNQVRRASVSITSNLAEGFNRQSRKEKVQFYYTSLGSLNEVQNQLLISKDLGYLKKETFEMLAEKSVVVSKLINGLIKSIKQ